MKLPGWFGFASSAFAQEGFFSPHRMSVLSDLKLAAMAPKTKERGGSL